MGSIESTATRIVARLRAAGHEAYWVGGCVRDRLLGVALKDIDIATCAPPGAIAGLFDEVRFVGATFGVSIVVEDGHHFEVAAFRREGRYLDRRRPESVVAGTLEDDVYRRDFTCNALYYDPVDDRIIDFVGGRADIRDGLLRCVGDPWKRFDEDALRLLRAVRFSSRLGFRIVPETEAALRELAPTIIAISPERCRGELTSILVNANRERAFRMMDEYGLLEELLPEITAMHGVEQSPSAHPEGDVFEHTMLVLRNLVSDDPVTCWAALLHDVGKPATHEFSGGRHRFYGHEHVGARIAREVLRRFRFSRAETDRVCAVVDRHMRFLTAPEWNPSTMRRFIAAPTIEADLEVHRSDSLSSDGSLAAYEIVRDALVESRQARQATVPPALIDGNDLIAMGYEPGPAFSDVLEALRDAQLDGEVSGEEEARAWVAAWFASGEG